MQAHAEPGQHNNGANQNMHVVVSTRQDEQPFSRYPELTACKSLSVYHGNELLAVDFILSLCNAIKSRGSSPGCIMCCHLWACQHHPTHRKEYLVLSHVTGEHSSGIGVMQVFRVTQRDVRGQGRSGIAVRGRVHWVWLRGSRDGLLQALAAPGHLRQKPGHPSLVRPWGCQDRARADPRVSSHSGKCITLLAFSCKILLAGLGKALMWATALRWVCARIPALSLLSNLILIPSYLDDNMHSLRQILSNWGDNRVTN